MVKIVNQYRYLKNENASKMYFFLVGNFYIFIGEDAEVASSYLALKKTSFSKEYEKCGFPLNSLDKYQQAFELHHWDVEVIEQFQPFRELQKVDLSTIKIKEARDLLRKIKDYYEK